MKEDEGKRNRAAEENMCMKITVRKSNRGGEKEEEEEEEEEEEDGGKYGLRRGMHGIRVINHCHRQE